MKHLHLTLIATLALLAGTPQGGGYDAHAAGPQNTGGYDRGPVNTGGYRGPQNDGGYGNRAEVAESCHVCGKVEWLKTCVKCGKKFCEWHAGTWGACSNH